MPNAAEKRLIAERQGRAKNQRRKEGAKDGAGPKVVVLDTGGVPTGNHNGNGGNHVTKSAGKHSARKYKKKGRGYGNR